MPRLRLALVTETYPPEVNGVAMTVGRLVQGFRALGHRVDIWRPRQQGEARQHDQDVLLPGLSLPGYPELRLGLPAKSRLLKHWRAQRPDVVHVVTEGPLGWSAVAAARQLKLPVTSGFHTNFDRYSSHYGLGLLRPAVAAYLRAFHRRTLATQVPTEALAAELAGQGIPGVRVVGRGVDTRLFHPARRSAELRASWNAGDDTLVCLYVGRLAAEKNLDQVLASFAALQARRPGARMLWVGDGPARARLQAEHPEHLFAGMRRDADLAEHYASADLFLFPSLTETYGNVVAEAMASGLAVVAYKSAAAAELIVDGSNGRALSPGDGGAFSTAAHQLAEDDALRFELGQRAASSLAERGWDRVVERFEAVLRGVAQSGQIQQHL